jgi:hypothetical protein
VGTGAAHRSKGPSFPMRCGCVQEGQPCVCLELSQSYFHIKSVSTEQKAAGDQGVQAMEAAKDKAL